MIIAISLLQVSLSKAHSHRRKHDQQLQFVQTIPDYGPSAQLLSGISELLFESYANSVTFDPAPGNSYQILGVGSKNVLVANQWQKGRILAYGATLFNNMNFYNSQNGVLALIINSFDWLAGRKCAYKSKQPCKVLLFSTDNNNYGGTIYAASLKEITIIPTRVTSLDGLDLGNFQIIVVDAVAPSDDQTAAKVQAFIKNGGGALVSFISKKLDEVNILQNKVMAPTGVKITKEIVSVKKIIVPGQTPFSFNMPYLPKTTSQPSYVKQGELQRLLTDDVSVLQYSSRYSVVTIPESFVDIFSDPSKNDRFGGAGYFGQGRVVALGNSDLITKIVVTSSDSTKKLMKNVLNWVVKNKVAPRVAQLFGADCSAFDFFAGSVYIKVSDPSQLTVESFDVACFGNFKETPARLVEFKVAIRAFVENGGGLVTGANSIDWAKIRPVDFQTSFPYNVILREFGVLLLNGIFSRKEIRVASVSLDAPKVKAFLQRSVLPVLKGEVANYSDFTVIEKHRLTIQSLDSFQFETVCGWQLYNQLVDAFVASNFNPENGNALLCNSQPFKSTWDLLYDLSLLAPAEVARALPPSINGYPGVANTEFVTKTFEVPLDRNSWFFTGLYINPGETFEVEFAEGLWQENPFNNVKLRLNANDNLRGKSKTCNRCPIISQTYTLDKTKFSHYGGGFIAFVVDKKVEGMAAKITVTARQGNYYNQQLNQPTQVPALLLNDSPNIALQCRGATFLGRGRTNYIVHSIDVALACTYINLVMDDFGLFGFDTKPWTKQMFHADVMISAGSMHSGNPIQMFEGAFGGVLNIGNSSWKYGNWGLFHELGHNRQDARWTEKWTSEVTNNIYAEYFGHKLSGLSVLNRVPKLGPGSFDYQLTLKGRFFTFLGWFAVMMDEFGYDFFAKVQSLYFQKGVSVKTNEERYDQLCQMYSDVTGLNVYSYFSLAKMPTTTKCDEYAKALGRPQWHSDKYPFFTDYDYGVQTNKDLVQQEQDAQNQQQ